MNRTASLEVAFTTLSGCGFGLLIWLCLGHLSGYWMLGPYLGVGSCLLALGLVATGLIASRSQPGISAATQAPWAKRERVAGALTCIPALLFTAGWIPGLLRPEWMPASALAAAIGSAIAVCCNGMVWMAGRSGSNAWVALVWLGMALNSGLLLCLLVVNQAGRLSDLSLIMALSAVMAAWAINLFYWSLVDRRAERSVPRAGFRLQRLSVVSGLVIPALLIAACLVLDESWSRTALVLATASGLAGIAMARRLLIDESL